MFETARDIQRDIKKESWEYAVKRIFKILSYYNLYAKSCYILKDIETQQIKKTFFLKGIRI